MDFTIRQPEGQRTLPGPIALFPLHKGSIGFMSKVAEKYWLAKGHWGLVRGDPPNCLPKDHVPPRTFAKVPLGRGFLAV
jgi:hypothetical protein